MPDMRLTLAQWSWGHVGEWHPRIRCRGQRCDGPAPFRAADSTEGDGTSAPSFLLVSLKAVIVRLFGIFILMLFSIRIKDLIDIIDIVDIMQTIDMFPFLV